MYKQSFVNICLFRDCYWHVLLCGTYMLFDLICYHFSPHINWMAFSVSINDMLCYNITCYVFIECYVVPYSWLWWSKLSTCKLRPLLAVRRKGEDILLAFVFTLFEGILFEQKCQLLEQKKIFCDFFYWRVCVCVCCLTVPHRPMDIIIEESDQLANLQQV